MMNNYKKLGRFAAYGVTFLLVVSMQLGIFSPDSALPPFPRPGTADFCVVFFEKQMSRALSALCDQRPFNMPLWRSFVSGCMKRHAS